MKTIAETIKELREEKNLSQTELADKLHTSRSAISMWENGQREPNKEMKESICDFFNIDMNYLYGKTDIKNTFEIYNDQLSRELSNSSDKVKESLLILARNSKKLSPKQAEKLDTYLKNSFSLFWEDEDDLK